MKQNQQMQARKFKNNNQEYFMITHNDDKCLEESEDHELSFEKCDLENKRQHWKAEYKIKDYEQIDLS